MQMIFAIAAGGALGAVSRHYLNNMISMGLASTFPWGILIINILGSLLMGCAISAFAHGWDISQQAKAFLIVGLFGAFTTFSTFSMDVVTLIERQAYLSAGYYIFLSVFVSVVALFAGMILVRQVMT